MNFVNHCSNSSNREDCHQTTLHNGFQFPSFFQFPIWILKETNKQSHSLPPSILKQTNKLEKRKNGSIELMMSTPSNIRRGVMKEVSLKHRHDHLKMENFIKNFPQVNVSGVGLGNFKEIQSKRGIMKECLMAFIEACLQDTSLVSSFLSSLFQIPIES